jgi:hypothetical protein
MVLKPARRCELAVAVIGCVLFAGAYRQSPLFSGNQNTYFLWGLARAGFGHLSSDWLANLTDPVPLFTALVHVVQQAGSHWMFYALHGLLVAAYALSLFLLVGCVLPKRSSVTATVVAIALLTHIHLPWAWDAWVDALPGTFASAWTMSDWLSPVLTHGVAAQYILGPWLQPSAFGVLLLVSLASFVHRREFIAVGFAALAAAIHPTYLIQAVILVVGFVVALLFEGHRKGARRISVLALSLMAPLVLLVLWRMGPAGTNIDGGTRSVLYSLRVPHHADVTVWASVRDLWRVGLVGAAILLAWKRTRLRAVMLTAAGLTVALTALQFLTGSEALGLMFPWRASVWLVPAATAVIVGRGLGFLSSLAGEKLSERTRRSLSRSLVLCSAAFVTAACVLGIRGTARSAREGSHRPLVCGAVRAKAEPGLTYLVPLGFGWFRLETGLPIFVDWKSHPYRADELGEWFNRADLARMFYEADCAGDASEALRRIRGESPITHVIAPKETHDVLAETALRLVYRGPDHDVYVTTGEGAN